MLSGMSISEKRNVKIDNLMEELIQKAQKDEFKIKTSEEWKLKTVCATTIWGFREILLVICVARIMDSSFSASTNFYACNPRALFEGPIRNALSRVGIPHRKSGPLNIAKATVGINQQWAGQSNQI